MTGTSHQSNESKVMYFESFDLYNHSRNKICVDVMSRLATKIIPRCMQVGLPRYYLTLKHRSVSIYGSDQGGVDTRQKTVFLLT